MKDPIAGASGSRVRTVLLLGLVFSFLPSWVRAQLIPPLPSLEPTHDNVLEPVFELRPYVNALMRDIAHARQSVYVDYYILGGEIGREVGKLLRKKLREGVDVRVMLDPHLGVVGKLRDQVRSLIRFLEREKIPYRKAVIRRAGTVLHSWSEDHNKLVIIDREVAYVGGANITDQFIHYNDLMLRSSGPVVGKLVEQFLHDWELAGVPDVARAIVTEITYDGQGLLEPGSREGTSTVRLVGTGIGRRTFEGALLNCIDSARSSIRVQLHQLNHDPVLDALIAAKQRGVNVQALLDPTNIDNYIPLVKSGPRGIFNAYAVTRLQEAQVDVRFVKLREPFDAYHMKLGVFDDEVMLIGTANWDYLANRSSTETVFEVAGGPAVGTIRQWFDHSWHEDSEVPQVGYIAQVINFVYRLFN